MATTNVQYGATARVNLTTYEWELIGDINASHATVGIASVAPTAVGWLRWTYTAPLTRVVTASFGPDEKYVGRFAIGASVGLLYTDTKIVDRFGNQVSATDPVLRIGGSNFWCWIWGQVDTP